MLLSYIAGQAKDYLTELVLESGKDKLLSHGKGKALKVKIDEYFSRQYKHNESVSLSDELDLIALHDFIKSEAFQDAFFRFVDGNKRERTEAFNSLQRQCFYFANAKTPNSSAQVKKMLIDVCKTVKQTLQKELGHGEHILAARIEDTICEDNSEKQKEVMDRLSAIENKSALSLDAFSESVRKGNIDKAESILDMFAQIADESHILKEYYHTGFIPVGDKQRMVSIPRSEEAIRLYPPTIELEGNLSLGGKPIDGLTDKVIDYWFRHQIPLDFNVTGAKKLLGDKIDPYQVEAELYSKGKHSILPPPLSPALECEILVDGSVFYSNTELMVTEILEDGTKIISNINQVSADIRLSITVKEKMAINIRTYVEGATHKQLLQFNRFIQAMSKGGKAAIRNKESNTFMLQWSSDTINCNTHFKTLEEEIDFLERIICIEEYFGINFTMNEIERTDYEKVLFVSDIIGGKTRNGTWKLFELTEPVSPELKKFFRDSNGEFKCIFGPVNYEDQLFDKQISIVLYRFLSEARIVDFERKQKQVELSDNDERIIIKFEPLHDEGQMEEMSEQIALASFDEGTRDKIKNNPCITLVHHDDNE